MKDSLAKGWDQSPIGMGSGKNKDRGIGDNGNSKPISDISLKGKQKIQMIAGQEYEHQMIILRWETLQPI